MKLKVQPKVKEAFKALEDRESFDVEDFREYIRVPRNIASIELNTCFKLGALEVVEPAKRSARGIIAPTRYRVIKKEEE